TLTIGLGEFPALAGEDFDGRRAYQHVKNLVAMGPRAPGSAGIKAARRYIKATLRRYGVAVKEQKFLASTPRGPMVMENIIGVIPGKRDEIIIIGGHYETKYFSDFRFVGANDGGSSTGVLLELARSLARGKPRYTLWLAFFDGEEALVSWNEQDSLYGSRYMVKRLKQTGELDRIRAVMVLDMVGDKELKIEKVIPSTPWLTRIIWETASKLGNNTVFQNSQIMIEDDHTPFFRAGVPATTIIDFRYGSDQLGGGYWHTRRDTLDKVSDKSMEIVGKVVLTSLSEIGKQLDEQRRR
ncbi:MAG: M28 family peptidase, partial [Thermodesulfobacteriota bacterium]